MKFIYRSGQRPLDGYTIKRGVGQGGFGEVYFAVSDGGKEVALKLLRGQSDAELRGISHCLNLKHPNLVHLYDLREDDRGDRWVVMEYVFGESLAQVINRHPNGLPLDLVREWFVALARGVGYLHDQGVVHRDLKPANIFVEHGQLKVGDYGLSRRMSGSQGGEMTRGVGTPHYMAPEIKNGNYTRTIDIYACGVILFETLTGHPPFDGETPGEVLMKQQLDSPDLSKCPAAFVPVLEKALDKNPVRRFATMPEFARAVEEAAVRAGAPPTQSLPPVAAPPAPAASAEAPRRPVAVPVNRAEPEERPKFVSGPLPQVWRERLTELCGSFAVAPLIALLCTAPWAVFPSNAAWTVLGRVLLLSTALSWAVLVVARPPRRHDPNTWGRRFHLLLAGMAVGLLAFWLDGWAPGHGGSLDSRFTPDTISTGIRYAFYFGLAAAAMRWWRLTDRQRRERFRLFPLFAAGFWGCAFLFLWPWESAVGGVGVAPLVIAAVAVQVASPWAGQPSPIGRPGNLPRAPRLRHRYA